MPCLRINRFAGSDFELILASGIPGNAGGEAPAAARTHLWVLGLP